MFADPQSIASVSLPRTGSGQTSGQFQSGDATAVLSISHAYGKRTRRTARYTVSKVSADPLVPAQNIKPSMSCYIVVDVPLNGYSAAEQKTAVDAFVAWLAASTGANVAKILGGES